METMRNIIVAALATVFCLPALVVGQHVNDPIAPIKKPLSRMPQIQSGVASDALSTPSVIWMEDFETLGTSWKTRGSWQIGTPTSGPNAAFSGVKCAATNLSGNYGNNAADTLYSPNITLPSPITAGSTIKLQHKQWFQTESCCDYLDVYVSSDNGSTWTQLGQRIGGELLAWTDVEYSITSYAGSAVQFAFTLHTDASVVYPGWYIDDVKITLDIPIPPSPLNANLTSLDATLFPFVFAHVTVDTFGVGFPSLTRSDFSVYENGVPQTNYFAVTPPQTGGGVRRADIVFLMDNSGSMSDDIAAVSANAQTFVDSLVYKGVDFALGLCRYGASTNGGNPIVQDNGTLTTDANYFKTNVWARNNASGGTEPGYYSIVTSAHSFTFRPGSQKIFIIITDETPDQGGSTLNDAVTACANNGITLYVLTLASLNSTFEPITKTTNGAIFDISADFSPILNTIATSIAHRYVVQYKSSNPSFNGVTRNVAIVVSYNNNRDTVHASYTPGQAPAIERTPTTKGLHNQALIQNSFVTIEATVTDNIPPLAYTATVYYRTTGSATYSSLVMTNSSGSIWTATIPSPDINPPGIDYYITASDSQATSSDPLTQPADQPYQLAVLPNVAPAIAHTPVGILSPGNAIYISADIVDTTNSLDQVSVFYRKTGQLAYNSLLMSLSSVKTFYCVIPAQDVTVDGIDYYIYARDNFGLASYHGRPDNPHQITSSSTQMLGQTIITGFLSLNDSAAASGVQFAVQRKASNAIVASGVVVPENQGKNYAVSILQGSGGVQDGDTLVFAMLDQQSHSVPLRYGHPSIVFVASFPPAVIEYNVYFSTSKRLTVPVVQGYNAVSWNVKPSNDSVHSVFADLLSRGKIQIILGYQNDGVASFFDYYIPELGRYNPMQATSVEKGYFVKLRKNVSPDLLRIDGIRVYPSLPVILFPGYNLVGYLPVRQDSVSRALRSISGSMISGLDYINDGLGTPTSEHFEAYPVSHAFKIMREGKGYFVQSSMVATLRYPETSLIGMVTVAPKIAKTTAVKGLVSTSSLPTAVFAYSTNLTHNGKNVLGGSLVQAFDRENNLCGESRCAADGIVSIVIAGDDPTTQADEGCIPGERVRLTIDGARTNLGVIWGEFGDTPIISILTDVEENVGAEVPRQFGLHQNYPNPFNPTTVIRYDVPSESPIQLEIFNGLGQKIRTLVNTNQAAGEYSIAWNGRTDGGIPLASGLYFYTLKAGSFSKTCKMLLMK